MDVLSEELSYLVSDLNPFTDYTFRVSASTTVGEGPTTDITEKTREQGGWSCASCNIHKLKTTNKNKLSKVPNLLKCLVLYVSFSP